jgi:tetratricopeptide (TPR) repeat protein
MSNSRADAVAGRAIYIPFLKNLSFVGRDAELNTLKQRLMVNKECRKMSVVGLGGTGKTQVALQFAYTVKETWPEYSIFWVPALSMESFEQACVDIAKKLDIPQAAGGEEDTKELVRQYLSDGERVGKWLLVVDNVDDRAMLYGDGQMKGVFDYLPPSEEGIVVFTTRTLEVAVELTHSDVIELGAMNQQDATIFLARSLINKDLLCDSAATTDLLNELTCLPLAIAQAAAYLNKNTTFIRDYLRLLQNTEQGIVDIMSKEFRDNTRYKGMANAVATTWMVSFSQIRTRDKIAADLLSFISCIEWKSIPRSILPRVQSDVRMEDGIGTLCGYSFLVRRRNSDWYDVHRLVHLATRIWIRRCGDARTVAQRGIRHVARIFPSDDYTNQSVWQAYMPHSVRLLEDEQGWDVKEKSKLALQIGRCLLVDGRIPDAVKWLEESYKHRAKLNEEDLDRLYSQHELARAYVIDGQDKKAVELLEHVVAVQEKVLAEDHPNQLASQHELARAYEADGQVKKAVELLEHVVAVQEKVLAEDHPDQLASQNALAIAYEADGQVKKAVKLLEHVVAVQEKVLAEDHPDQLASQHALAIAYQADGQVKEAVELLEHVVAVRKKVLAEDHPNRLASQHALAMAYQADGQVKKAVELLEQVVAVCRRVLRSNHPSRFSAERNLVYLRAQLQL